MSAPEAGRRDVDRAALLGTALAAVVALTFGGQGPWEWLATASGVALLAVLAAFFRLPTGERRTLGADRAELVAVAAVAALAATLVIATPLQVVIESATPLGRSCQESAALAEAVVATDPARQAAAGLAVTRLAAAGTVAGNDDVVEQAAADAGRTVRGECLGAVTTQWLWIPAVAIAVLIFLVADARMRRLRRR